MKTLFLSIGHNWGKNTPSSTPDQGASGVNTTEAKETKKIVDALLAKGIPGVKVVKVPEGLNLPQRIKWINDSLRYPLNCPEPMALEFHMDANGSPTPAGASVWFNDYNTYTQGEGKQFLAKYTEVTGISSRHVNSDKTNRLGDLGFVSELKCAALLVELGFITNPGDLKTVQTKGFDAVYAGILAMNAS